MNYYKWHKWFAWRPVITEDGKCLFLRKIWRIAHPASVDSSSDGYGMLWNYLPSEIDITPLLVRSKIQGDEAYKIQYYCK